MNTATESMISRVLAPVFTDMPPDVTQRLLSVRADEELQQRVEYLAGRANEGELTEEERNEYKAYVDAGDILATLQAIARQTLQRAIA
ncbi:MAG: hypothetical protein O3A00_03425 [Planctomycetota bacterium]|nr:hypothetical protein [Planctomycetota bacterium]